MRILLPLVCAFALIAQTPTPNGAAINPPWTSGDVIQVPDLVKIVAAKGANSPAIFQVGFEKLYTTQHVPGSIYAGPGRTDAGLDNLKKAVAGVAKDRTIVLYCGCCPWDHCPNMKPAFALLHSLGYTRIKVVEIPKSFGEDWAAKGYAVEGSGAK